jgi:hypothetical protein
MIMKTTLRKIKEFDPCGQDEDDNCGFSLLKKNIGSVGLDTEVSLMQILESNGIRDAILALRCFTYKDYCLFLADIAESVYHIYKKKNPKDTVIWECIQAIHYFKHGFITIKKLKKHAYDAYAAYAAAAAAADDAAYAYAYTYAYADADAAYAAYAAVYDAYDAAYAYAAAARDSKWKEIEQLFIKHFGDI